MGDDDMEGCWDYKLKSSVRNQARYKGILQDVRRFSFRSIQMATNDFTSKLSSDVYSDSYQGTLESRAVVVQVIQSANLVKDQLPHFISLVNKMSKIRHRNVAGFIGCCLEGNHTIVVYEFTGRRRLEQLFDSNPTYLELSWRQRASICVGVARGLDYLHNGMSTPVVHGNSILSNVIFDEHYNPEIGGFGILTVTIPSSQLMLESRSYGYLLLQVISGRKIEQNLRDGTDFTLLDWVRQHLRDGTDFSRNLDIIDPKLVEFPEDEVIRFVKVALACVQSSPKLRPSMSLVLHMLSGGYDINKNALRKPQYPGDVKNSGEIEIHAGGNASSTDNYYKASLSEIRSPRSGATVPTTDAEGKMIYEDDDVKGCRGYKLELDRNQAKYKDVFQDVKLYSFRSIRKATNNFSVSSKLDSGGFSNTYKGTLKNRTIVVEVYRYKSRARVDFISLINMMSKIRHRNLVEFIGCCVEGKHRIVVFEFAGRQSLNQLIHSYPESLELSWRRRASICVGVARGLDYLHNGLGRQVVHRDIKPGNVVFDENYNPKIVGFNGAILLDDKLSDYSGPIAGTYGHIDPEYLSTGIFTEKADVYGFGVLLLQVISGRKLIENLGDGTYFTLLDWVREQQENDRALDIIDPNISEFPEDEVIRFIDVALSCVQRSPDFRPSMSEVLLMLSGGYDFNKNALRKRKLLVDDKKLGEIDIHVGSNVSSTDNYHKASLSEIISVGRGASVPTTDTKGKMICGPESEADIEAELMQMSQDLETELYSSIEEKIPGAISESGPSYRTVLKPEIMSTSSECNVLVQKGGVEVKEQIVQRGLKRSIEPEIHETESISGPSLETSAEPQIIATTAQVTHTFIQSEVINELPLQAEIQHENETLSPPKVDMDRPIYRTIQKIFEALEDAQSRRIGLHGRSGSGKTNVLKTLFHHHLPYFDHVIFVTVPRLPHRRILQNVIMQQLSLTIPDSHSEDEIAVLIFQVFTRKKVLFLLDDVWETINLHEIGIPNLGVNDSFCLIFATRSLDVCHAMADRGVEMEALSELEAWGLFCNQVGGVVHSREIQPYAHAIAMKCHGLALIISAVASALRSKSSVVEWKFALWSFQIPDACNTDDPYSSNPQIKYCYHKLKGRDVKTCFLYSALFPTDIEIDKSMLVDCLIAERLLGGRTVVSYKRGHDIIEQLINARLLEPTENDGMVKMPNVIRDSALAILSSDIEGYQVMTRYYLRPSTIAPSKRFEVQKYMTGAGAQLKNPPELEEWTMAEMIFLMDNEFSRLPDKPTCPNLQALFLQRNSCLRVIPTSFFDGMCGLRMLNLSNTRIKSLPDSFLKLKNLEVLAMRDCERLLTLPQSIGHLKALQVLDLEGTELTHLPDSISELASLKNLRVSFYGLINPSNSRDLPAKLIPAETIMTLDLQELGIFVHPGDRRWASCVSNIIEEINNLKLSSLCFHFPEIDHLDHFQNRNQSWTNGDLTMFNFIVGRDFQHVVSRVPYDAEMMYSGEERCLRYVNGEDIPHAVKVVLSCSTSFYLDHHLSVCSLSDFGIERMHTMKICILRDCPKLTKIIGNDYGTTVLPFLEYLSINYLWNLEQIWSGVLKMGSFAKLKYLSVHACPKLRYVFTCDMLDMFPNLEELVIEDCATLQYIVFEDTLARSPPSPVLRNLKVLKLHYLPQLSGLWKGCWPSLEYISFYNCPKLKNLHLLANDAINIKEIAAEKTWWDLLEWDDLTISTRLQELVTQIDDL